MTTPDYYKRAGHECRELSGTFRHPLASAIEYVWRHKGKNGIEDIRKALDWLEWDRKNRHDCRCIDFDKTNRILDSIAAETEGHEQRFWQSVKNNDWNAAETALRELIEQEQ